MIILIVIFLLLLLVAVLIATWYQESGASSNTILKNLAGIKDTLSLIRKKYYDGDVFDINQLIYNILIYKYNLIMDGSFEDKTFTDHIIDYVRKIKQRHPLLQMDFTPRDIPVYKMNIYQIKLYNEFIKKLQNAANSEFTGGVSMNENDIIRNYEEYMSSFSNFLYYDLREFCNDVNAAHPPVGVPPQPKYPISAPVAGATIADDIKSIIKELATDDDHNFIEFIYNKELWPDMIKFIKTSVEYIDQNFDIVKNELAVDGLILADINIITSIIDRHIAAGQFTSVKTGAPINITLDILIDDGLIASSFANRVKQDYLNSGAPGIVPSMNVDPALPAHVQAIQALSKNPTAPTIQVYIPYLRLRKKITDPTVPNPFINDIENMRREIYRIAKRKSKIRQKGFVEHRSKLYRETTTDTSGNVIQSGMSKLISEFSRKYNIFRTEELKDLKEYMGMKPAPAAALPVGVTFMADYMQHLSKPQIKLQIPLPYPIRLCVVLPKSIGMDLRPSYEEYDEIFYLKEKQFLFDHLGAKNKTRYDNAPSDFERLKIFLDSFFKYAEKEFSEQLGVLGNAASSNTEKLDAINSIRNNIETKLKEYVKIFKDSNAVSDGDIATIKAIYDAPGAPGIMSQRDLALMSLTSQHARKFQIYLKQDQSAANSAAGKYEFEIMKDKGDRCYIVRDMAKTIFTAAPADPTAEEYKKIIFDAIRILTYTPGKIEQKWDAATNAYVNYDIDASRALAAGIAGAPPPPPPPPPGGPPPAPPIPPGFRV